MGTESFRPFVHRVLATDSKNIVPGDFVSTNRDMASPTTFRVDHLDGSKQFKRSLCDRAEHKVAPVSQLADLNGQVVLTYLPANSAGAAVVVGQLREVDDGGKAGTVIFVAEDDGGPLAAES